MIPEKAYIYGLYDPRIPDVIWYVGKTNNPRTRLQYYRKDSSTTPVYRWFRRLQSEGSEPKLRVLEECPFAEWKDRERAVISLYRKKNLLLLNKLDGGNGTEVKGRKEFCSICGTKRIRLYPSDSSLRCPVCRKQKRTQYMENWHEKNPGYKSEYLKNYYVGHRQERLGAEAERYKRRREAGLCSYCSNLARPTRVTCESHAGRR